MSSEPTPPTKKSDNTRLIIAGVAVLLLLWFMVANSHRVKINWWIFDRESRLIYVIIVSAVLGAIVDRLFLAHKKKS